MRKVNLAPHDLFEWFKKNVGNVKTAQIERRIKLSTKYKDGEPCNHPGCLSHFSHPCEGCGRVGGRDISNFRVIILKHVNDHIWSIYSNPSWGFFERSCSDILLNQMNSYVEYENCGVQHRMIRFCDLEKYCSNILSTPINKWTLNPDDKTDVSPK